MATAGAEEGTREGRAAEAGRVPVDDVAESFHRWWPTVCHRFPGHNALNVEHIRYDLWCRLVAECEAIEREHRKASRPGRSDSPGRIHARAR